MKKTRLATVMAIFIAGATLASAAHAQNKPVEAWEPPPAQELDPARRAPEQARQSNEPAYAGSQQRDYAYQQQPSAGYERGRGGFFLGAKGGRGKVYQGVSQSAREINAGYRWQAGPVALVGIEVAGGKLGGTTKDGGSYSPVDFASIGANARFNFGRGSRVYAVVRGGYWSAEETDYDADVDGGYFGVGLGVDVTRHFNLGLTYTNYVYSRSGYWDHYDDVNRADTLMFGAEVRF